MDELNTKFYNLFDVFIHKLALDISYYSRHIKNNNNSPVF